MSLFGKGYNDKAIPVTDKQKRTVDSGVYQGTVKNAFIGKSAGGATSVSLEVKLDSGKTIFETIYVTNREGNNTYEKDGVIGYLPGFLTVNQIVLFATGKDLYELEPELEERIVKQYDSKAGKQADKPAMVIVPLLEQPILVGIKEVRENKTKAGDGNKRITLAEDRVYNTIDKVFHPSTYHTQAELEQEKEATYIATWEKDNEGKLDDRYKSVESANSATVSKPSSTGLFKNL